MANSVIVSIRDSAMQSYARPFFVPTIAVAVRSFTDEVNRQSPDNQMFVHPEDFELYVIGVFDDEAGEFLPAEDGIRCLARGKDVKLPL